MTAMWSSVLEKNTTPIDLDWQNYAGGAKTSMEFLEAKGALAVAPGTSYIAPQEAADITVLRNRCQSVIVSQSWKMVFAQDEEEFDRLLQDMKETVDGLGYERVLAVDLQNAKEEAASRQQEYEQYLKANQERK